MKENRKSITLNNINNLNKSNDEHKDLEKNEVIANDDDSLDNIQDIAEWKEYHENILVDWADKAICYRWLHSKSCNKYTYLRNIYTIPVIILSTLTGTANFALERIPPEYQGYCQIGIGSLNILAGIITTISQFLKINELSEAHRVSCISWDKFYRNIRVELVKCPSDRTNVTYLIKACKDEYDRLMETSPDIDNTIINEFHKTFKTKLNKEGSIHTAIKSLNKPEILDSIESTKNIVYKIDEKTTANENLMNIIKNKKEQMDKENIIENFVETFQKEYSRKPSIIEIYDNLENKVNNNAVQKFLSSSKWLNRSNN